MANILITIEKDVQVGASDLLKFITGANKQLGAAPQVVAALGVVLGAVSTAVTTGEGAVAASGLNIALDEAELTAIKAVWPDVVAFLATLGVKV
jgi:hypothetical protein